MQEKTNNRPPFLSALCILTFFGSGAGFIGYFLASLFFEETSELIIKYSNWHSVEAISPLYFTLFMMLSAISLVGAIRMWKLHRDGFYVYTLAQIVLLGLPLVWIGWHAFSSTAVIFTLVFTGGYAFNLKHLK